MSAPLVITPRRAIAQSSFPSFNVSGIDPGTISAAQDVFVALANSLYSSNVADPSLWSQASQIYGVLANQLTTSGFSQASLRYLQTNPMAGDPDILYNLLSSTGLVVPQSEYPAVISKAFGSQNTVIIPKINNYGIPQCHYGTQVALDHFGSATQASAARVLPAIRKPTAAPVGKGFFTPDLERPVLPPDDPQPGPGENFCSYVDWGLAT